MPSIYDTTELTFFYSDEKDPSDYIKMMDFDSDEDREMWIRKNGFTFWDKGVWVKSGVYAFAGNFKPEDTEGEEI